VRDAAWGCDWVGTPVPFQRCLTFIIATANKEFTLTAGKFVPVSNSTMMNASIWYTGVVVMYTNILEVRMKIAVIILILVELNAPF
jgi:hypothetical protein